MNKSDIEKCKLGYGTLFAFMNQFGELDAYHKIVLEVLFEEIYSETGKDISISSTTRQDGDQSSERI